MKLGTCGREPAATMIWSAVISISSSPWPVRMRRGPTNVAWRSYTVMCGVSGPRRYASPPEAMGSMRRPNTRCLIWSQSTESSVAWTPRRSASATLRAASAASTYIFVGMQPTLRHVPPNLPFSTSAMFMPSKAGEGMELPDPAPMMMRS